MEFWNKFRPDRFAGQAANPRGAGLIGRFREQTEISHIVHPPSSVLFIEPEAQRFNILYNFILMENVACTAIFSFQQMGPSWLSRQ
jgi:hypothetical protein